jgi:hypothetical protein
VKSRGIACNGAKGVGCIDCCWIIFFLLHYAFKISPQDAGGLVLRWQMQHQWMEGSSLILANANNIVFSEQLNIIEPA